MKKKGVALKRANPFFFVHTLCLKGSNSLKIHVSLQQLIFSFYAKEKKQLLQRPLLQQ